jgi:hypothetical protein
MFKNRAFLFALIYSTLVIAYKLIIYFGGFSLTKFGFYFSHITSVIAIIPFIFMTVYFTRQDNNGVIGGKEALKTGLRMAVFSALFLSIYNYVEFEMIWRDLSLEYYNSQDFKDFLGKNPQIKLEEYPTKIEEAIASISAFKAVTSRLFVLLFFSLGASFMSSVVLKKK